MSDVTALSLSSVRAPADCESPLRTGDVGVGGEGAPATCRGIIPGVATVKPAEDMVGAVPPALRGTVLGRVGALLPDCRGAIPGRGPSFRDEKLVNTPGR